MIYSDFTIQQLQKEFGIKTKVTKLFSKVKELKPNDLLQRTIQLTKQLPIRSEKAKSEIIITPLLLDLLEKNEQYFTIYSGDRLEANAAKGLTGECDFIIAKNTNSYEINLPLLMLVEAQRDNVEVGLAQMLGAKIYNEANQQVLGTIYGCVTTGYNWHFLKLVDSTLFVDNQLYYWVQLPKLLGIFQHIIDEYKAIL